MIRVIRNIIITVLAIGLPIFIYVGFIAQEPIFEPEVDVELGRQTALSIASDPDEYPVLDRDSFPEIYAYLQRMVDDICDAPEIQYGDLFRYDSILIINRDDVLNAFCTPGGYIYVYSGLMKYLDSEDHLAGVLAHEVAHAEMRHSAKKLQKEFGRNRILEFAVLSTPVGLTDVINISILNNLVNLSYSRKQEAQADDLAVQYLATSDYACNGTGGFFQKMLDSGDDVRVPEFLSDHPSSKSRVSNVNRRARELGCSTELDGMNNWARFQNSLERIPRQPAQDDVDPEEEN